jgi:hypothetical protein
MLALEEKILYLEKILNLPVESYADSFRTDILFFFDEFNISNPMFSFLDKLNTYNEIQDWITLLTSKIVLRFDEENEHIGDFIYEYLN